MTAQFSRAPYPGRTAGVHQEPHAALLIDFDNVTMGIRSDLTKELKNLLNSAVIKGKVAVQRAYADWRRYPQYIVPLAEASVDLIFAPAYGSSKKNATDIRLAIDALELVFTRSEIGTFILLSGDSDFSSLVLKLKEYGKYVIGVGIRESASDLLVQNCDEYYSYSALTGLTRAGDQVAAGDRADPWELVDIAVRRMAAEGDVMRSDRLKQVMLEVDANFDEKTLGFSKFNRFVQEAASRGVLKLHKMENGQFEVALPDGEAQPEAERPAEEERADGRRGRGRRGRGRRDQEAQARNGAGDREGREAGAQVARAEGGAARAEAAPPAPAPMEEAEVAELPDLDAVLPAAQAHDEPSEALRPAYDLLRRAAADVAADSGGAARDSDVKRRMLEIQKDWDESAYGFSKFSRFLRQAHDADVITLRRLENGNYEVLPRGAESIEPAPRGDVSRRRGRRGRSEERPARTEAREAVAGSTASAGPSRLETPVEPSSEPAAAKAEVSAADRPAPAAPKPAPSKEAGTPAGGPAAEAAHRSIGPRRGSRGRMLGGPPPLLAGQAIPVARSAAPDAPPSPAGTPERAGAEAISEQPASRRKGRGRGREVKKQTAGAAPVAGPEPAADTRTSSALDAKRLGLPTEAAAVIDYLSTSYKGVGRRSGEMLIEAFGAANVFDALQNHPDRVRELLGDNRGSKLLDAWRADHVIRRLSVPRSKADSADAVGAAGDAKAAVDGGAGGLAARGARSTPESSPAPAESAEKPKRPRGRRGGRKRAASGRGAA